MIKAIIFDIDDTLIKTYESKKEAMKDFAQKYFNKKLEDDSIKANWGRPIRELINLFFDNPDNVEDIFEKWVKHREDYPAAAYEGTVETLNELAKKYMLGIVTSKSKRYTESDLNVAGIPTDIFFHIQTDEESNAHKPDPAVFDVILQMLREKGIEKNQVLYIGDSLSDFYAARDAGLRFYAVADRTTPKEKLEAQGAKTLTTISELLDVVNK